MAVCAGLEALKIEGCEVTIYTDSKYVADSVEKGWVFGWEKKQYAEEKKSGSLGQVSECHTASIR